MVVVVGYRKAYSAPDTAHRCGVASIVLSAITITMSMIIWIVVIVHCVRDGCSGNGAS